MSIDFLKYIFDFLLILNENLKNTTENTEFRRELIDLILN
jgi:hypothetical protein